ncbi:hypothetical protein BC332_19044 [Capsicum chinense]|nr:hypothetical protein BC332_19044 [Capsicum chinense]
MSIPPKSTPPPRAAKVVKVKTPFFKLIQTRQITASKSQNVKQTARVFPTCADKEPKEENIDHGGLETSGQHYSSYVVQNSDKMFDGTNIKEQYADKESEQSNINDGGLETSEQYFSSDKIDVCFYYLRKKSKYEPHSSYKYITVDCNFMNIIRSVIEVYSVDDPNLNAGGQEYYLNEYINGFCMHAAVPWYTVDNIFIPINIKDKHHWVLVVLSFLEKCIFLYDSCESFGYYAVVLSKIDKLAEIIPLCLHACNFYEKKEGLPQQPSESLDCGLYMVTYAECLSYSQRFSSIEFNPDAFRTRYAALLWDYGIRKQEANAHNDVEAPLRPVRKRRITSVTEVLEV